MITFMWIIEVELKFSGIKEGDYLDMIGFVGLPPATVFAFMCGQSFFLFGLHGMLSSSTLKF